MKTMQRYVVVAILLVATMSLGHAQDNDMEDRKFRFGLLASPNLGWLRPSIKDFEKDGLQSRLGFGYGLMMDWKFSDSPNYLLSTGINSTTNGGGLIEPWDSLSITPGDTSYFYGKADRTYRLQYVNLPIQLKMRTNEIGYMSYFGAIGFDVGVRTRAFANHNFEWEQSGLVPPDERDINIQNEIQLFRLGLNLSAGGEFNLSGNTNLFISASYHNHFTNMFRGTPQNRMLEPDGDGTPVLDTDGQAVIGKQRKAVSNYVALNIGIFF